MVEEGKKHVDMPYTLKMQKYVAVFYTPEEIEAEGLRSVIPQRKLVSKKPLTMNCLSNSSAKHDSEKWENADKPNAEQKKKILGLALAMGVKIVMTNQCRRQVLPANIWWSYWLGIDLSYFQNLHEFLGQEVSEENEG